MTEAEWLSWPEPTNLLNWLGRKAGDRKRRLFACACCRRVWEERVGKKVRDALDVAERYADRGATTEELRAAYFSTFKVRRPCFALSVARGVMAAADDRPAAVHAADHAAQAAYLRVPVRSGRSAQEDRLIAAERACQADLVRDIIGNPFHRVASEPKWLTEPVFALARFVYEKRAFDRLPVLADALEEAGCNNVEALAHCREPGNHVRGCWVVDLLLGKK